MYLNTICEGPQILGYGDSVGIIHNTIRTQLYDNNLGNLGSLIGRVRDKNRKMISVVKVSTSPLKQHYLK